METLQSPPCAVSAKSTSAEGNSWRTGLDEKQHDQIPDRESGELLVKWAAHISRHHRGYQRTVRGKLTRMEKHAQLRTARDAYDRQRAL